MDKPEQMKDDWYGSDHHLGHLRIPELAGRPFQVNPESVEEMNAEIIRRHNEVVHPGDRVTFLGDFAMGTLTSTLPLIREFAGIKELFAGNHDRPFPGYHHKSITHAEWAVRYREAGFAEVFYNPPYMKRSIAGNQVFISHLPYLGGGDSHGTERYAEYRLPDKGDWLICGHVHQKWRQRGRMINVGIDAWGGYPVPKAEIIALMEAGPRDLDVIPWEEGQYRMQKLSN